MFKFDELTFITHRDWPDEDLYPDTRAKMALARTVYPELEDWSLSGLFNAASEFSQSVLAGRGMKNGMRVFWHFATSANAGQSLNSAVSVGSSAKYGNWGLSNPGCIRHNHQNLTG